MAEPLHATRRDPSRPTAAGRAVALAEMFGISLLPWQRACLDVALEVDEAGLPAHRDVIVSTPRQAGKSVLLFVVLMDRLLAGEDQTLLFAAQTRMAARSRLIDGWWPRLARSPLAEDFRLKKGAGFEALHHVNGSVLRLLSSEESSGHGESVDIAVLDECWALEAFVEDTVRPATIARPGSQIWCVSTAGTPRSEWFRSKVESGRAAAAADATDPVFVEYAAPVDADPGDPAVRRASHPAIGHTVDEATIAADYATLPPAKFARSYLNQWGADLGDAGWNVIGQDVWKAALL